MSKISFLYSWLDHDYDLFKILDFVNVYLGSNTNKKILDVGCGYGKKLIPIQEKGYDILGIDINPEIIRYNQKNNLNCISIEDFKGRKEEFDLIILSHIIEHFQPDELIGFMDFYLDRLSPRGYLIIATPLPCNHFYCDFTHIRPYWPGSISMIFGDPKAQVKYKARNRLRIVDLWFRKQPYKPLSYKQKYWPRGTSEGHVSTLVELISLLLFKISFHWIGIADGWVGVFQKASARD